MLMMCDKGFFKACDNNLLFGCKSGPCDSCPTFTTGERIYVGSSWSDWLLSNIPDYESGNPLPTLHSTIGEAMLDAESTGMSLFTVYVGSGTYNEPIQTFALINISWTFIAESPGNTTLTGGTYIKTIIFKNFSISNFNRWYGIYCNCNIEITTADGTESYHNSLDILMGSFFSCTLELETGKPWAGGDGGRIEIDALNDCTCNIITGEGMDGTADIRAGGSSGGVKIKNICGTDLIMDIGAGGNGYNQVPAPYAHSHGGEGGSVGKGGVRVELCKDSNIVINLGDGGSGGNGGDNLSGAGNDPGGSGGHAGGIAAIYLKERENSNYNYITLTSGITKDGGDGGDASGGGVAGDGGNGGFRGIIDYQVSLEGVSWSGIIIVDGVLGDGGDGGDTVNNQGGDGGSGGSGYPILLSRGQEAVDVLFPATGGSGGAAGSGADPYPPDPQPGEDGTPGEIIYI